MPSTIKRIITRITGDAAAKTGDAKSPSLDKSVSEIPLSKIRKLEKALGYEFADRALLEQSLTHPSYLLRAKNQLANNQRLEFLGDSVIQLVLTEALYSKYSKLREGKLTSLRAGYARGDYMANIARKLGLQDYIILKKKDRDAGVATKDSALGDTFEAVVGAIYLDSDWETARKITLCLYDNLDTDPGKKGEVSNPKGKLQELVQPKFGNSALKYLTTDESGDPHNRTFEVAVLFNEKKIGSGSGKTKKEAEENAARVAIESWTTES